LTTSLPARESGAPRKHLPEPHISPRAEAGLDAIDDYLFEQDSDVAERYARESDRHFHLLAERPHLGRASAYAPNLRRFAMHSYIIFYRPVSGGIEIVRVLHGARNLDEVFVDDDL